LAAILAADVAGFSALMERDEEGTYSRIGNLRREVIEPRLAEHQGRLIKTTGDGFLAEFASPIAAVRCALAIQGDQLDNANALRLRIGLNLGRRRCSVRRFLSGFRNLGHAGIGMDRCTSTVTWDKSASFASLCR
jgi:class 3 adenylate cyclase